MGTQEQKPVLPIRLEALGGFEPVIRGISLVVLLNCLQTMFRIEKKVVETEF